MGDFLEAVVIPLTVDPTRQPTWNPSIDPTGNPSINPTFSPTKNPTIDPSFNPTEKPTFDPTVDPTQNPVIEASAQSNAPTEAGFTSTVAGKSNDENSEFWINLVIIISFVLFLTCCGLALCAVYVWRNNKQISAKHDEDVNQVIIPSVNIAKIVASASISNEFVPGKGGRTHDSIYEEGIITTDRIQEVSQEDESENRKESVSDDMFGLNSSGMGPTTEGDTADDGNV